MSTKPVATGTDLQIATDPFFSDIVNEDDGTVRTYQRFEQDEIPSGIQLYGRVRYTSDATGESDWSPYVLFHVEVSANIIGIAFDATNQVINYIDINGNKVSTFRPEEHPVFANCGLATLDNDRAPFTATKIPKFWIRTVSSGPLGSYAEGKPCWWLSDAEQEGFRPHPAFKRSTSRGKDGKYVLNDFIYIGTYLGHLETVGDSTATLGSKQNQTVATGKKWADLKALIESRNDDASGNVGYHCTDIWEISALRWLGVMATRSFDFQTVFGDNTAESPRTGSSKAKLILRGSKELPTVYVDDAWNCYWQFVDLISVNDGVVSLTSPMDRTSGISFSGDASERTISRTRGWIKSFISKSFILGDHGHDLQELFLPKTVASGMSEVLVPDYHEASTSSSEYKVGGFWSSGNNGGLFADTVEKEYTSETIHHPAIPAGNNAVDFCGQGTIGPYFWVDGDAQRLWYSVSLTETKSISYFWGWPEGNLEAMCERSPHGYAPCTKGIYDEINGTCPKGWGTVDDYNNKLETSCYRGVRYSYSEEGSEEWDEVKETFNNQYAVRVSKS